jgi:hypothetical protein
VVEIHGETYETLSPELDVVRVGKITFLPWTNRRLFSDEAGPDPFFDLCSGLTGSVRPPSVAPRDAKTGQIRHPLLSPLNILLLD